MDTCDDAICRIDDSVETQQCNLDICRIDDSLESKTCDDAICRIDDSVETQQCNLDICRIDDSLESKTCDDAICRIDDAVETQQCNLDICRIDDSLESKTCDDDICSPIIAPTAAPTAAPTFADDMTSDDIDDIEPTFHVENIKHWSVIGHSNVADKHIIESTVETNYHLTSSERPVFNIISVSPNGCLEPSDFEDNFDAWPSCSNVPKPSGNWSSYISSVFDGTNPISFNSSHLVDPDFNLYPRPPQHVEGWNVGVSSSDVDTIEYDLTLNVGSAQDSCGIIPSVQNNFDNYNMIVSVTSFFKADDNTDPLNNERPPLLRTCDEKQLEVNVDTQTRNVAAFDANLGVFASIEDVDYKTCSQLECKNDKGPEQSCQQHNALYRRLAVTFSINKPTGANITNIIANDLNCFGFGEQFSINNTASTIVVESSCMNMIDNDNVNCETFKQCDSNALSNIDYSVNVELTGHSGKAVKVLLDLDIDITQCPEYQREVENIQFESQLDFFKGQGNKGVDNPTKEYTIGDELLVALQLNNASSTGAHNLRVEQVKVCLLDNPTPTQLSCIVNGIDCPDGLSKGCQKTTWNSIQGQNPIQIQHMLLKDFNVTQQHYMSSRCKNTFPPVGTASSSSQCHQDVCTWDVDGKENINSWDAFRIEGGLFLRDGGEQNWIVDVIGDITYCNELNTPQRRLRAVWEHKNTIRLRNSNDKHETESVSNVHFLGMSPEISTVAVPKTSSTNESTYTAIIVSVIVLLVITCIALMSCRTKKGKEKDSAKQKNITPIPSRSLKVTKRRYKKTDNFKF